MARLQRLAARGPVSIGRWRPPRARGGRSGTDFLLTPAVVDLAIDVHPPRDIRAVDLGAAHVDGPGVPVVIAEVVPVRLPVFAADVDRHGMTAFLDVIGHRTQGAAALGGPPDVDVRVAVPQRNGVVPAALA